MNRLLGYGLVALLACVLFGAAPGASFASVITLEDFEGGAAGWTNNTTTNGGSTFTTFLGNFGNGGATSKTFALSGSQTQVTVSFNIYEIDSWDYEYFYIYVNDALYSSKRFKHNEDDSSYNAITKIFPGDNGNINYGLATWPDQGYYYEFTLATTATSLKLGFGSNLNQASSDESWGVDNLSIIDNSQAVPVPASLLLLGSGLVGLAGLRRRPGRG